MAIVKAKLRFSSLSPNSLSFKLTFSSESHFQIKEEEKYNQNDAAVISNTTPNSVVTTDEKTIIVDKLFELIQQYHLQNPKSGRFAPNPNLKIPSLSLQFSKITALPSSKPLPPSVVQRVIQKCGGVRDSDAPVLETLAFFNWATSHRAYPRVQEPYNAMIEFAGRLRNFTLVLDLIDLMRSRNVNVTSFTVFVVARSYIRAGLIDEAVNVFDRFRDCGCEPDGLAFKAVVSYLCEKKRAIEVQWLFDRLKDRFMLDVSLYNKLLDVWCRRGNVLEATRVFMDMKHVGVIPNVYSYSSMIDAMCRQGQIVRASEMFAEMVEAGYRPDRVTFNSLMFAHLKEKKYDKVLELYDVMKRLQCLPGTITCNYVMTAHCKQNNLEEAIGLLDFMYTNECMPNVMTYNILLGCIANLKKAKIAQLICERRMDLKIKPDVAVYNRLISMFGHLKETDGVLDLKKDMEKKNIVPNGATYHLLLRLLCRKGHWENAYRVFTEMIEERQLKPEEKTYEMVIKQLKKAGELEKVEELAQKMVAMKYHALPSK